MDNSKETPRYRVNTLSWIDGDLVHEGREVPYRGIPGSNLEPVNDAAEAMVAKYGRREVPEAPMLPVEPSVPVDWQSIAAANGWAPPTMANPEKAAQAPQPAPKPAPVEGKAGGAAAKLNKAGDADI